MKNIKIKRLNIFDFTLLIVVIALVFGAYLKLNSKKISLYMQKEETAYLNVDVLAVVDGGNVGLLEKGEMIFDVSSGSSYGKITNCHIPDGGTTTLRVKTTVKRDKTGTYINSRHLTAPGMSLFFALDDGSKYIGKINSISYPK